MIRRCLACFAVLVLIALMPSGARASERFDFGAGVGYSHVSLHGAASPFDHRDGARIEPRFSFGLSDQLPQLRLGVGVGLSEFSQREDSDGVIVIGGDRFDFDADDVQALSLIVPEVQISWRQTFGGEQRWFVEPGAALGVVIGNYWVGRESDFFTDKDASEWDATIGGRPFLRGGYLWDRFMVGVEASYLFGGNLDFTDQIRGDVRVFYAGVFFAGRW
jgi:hypothetical protein